MKNESPNPKLKQLEVFLGEWELQAIVDGQPMGRGRVAFEWTERGAFLLQRAETISTEGIPQEWLEKLPTPLTTIVGLDDTGGQFTQLYADARGVYRVYQMTFDGKTWKLWRDALGFHQRFKGVLSEDGKTITAYWEASEDGESWKKDFDLTYTKVET